ncbi:MAG: enoyl-CoA hydratase/isomerase family protein [Chloroflexi bacterium]|nr:enoyl-CoA hydratase/isomerase family protein [Chloroflexota bacterium]
MDHEMIITEQHGRVGVIKFNRPDRLNALHGKMSAEARGQIEEWNSDPSIGAIVLTGEGRAFCAGADMGGWQRQIEAREQGANGERRAPARPARDDSWTEMWQRSKPSVCAINGPAIGAGLTITLGADVRVASPQARLSMRFVRVGVMPELASTYLLSHIVGVSHALDLTMSGRIISGDEAGRIGLVNRVVEPDKLLDEAIALAAEYAFNPAPSVRAAKRQIWENVTNVDIRRVMREEMREFVAAQRRPHFKEAVTAFREKRDPDFHNLDG